MCRDMSLTDLAYVLAFSAMRSGAFNTPDYIILYVLCSNPSMQAISSAEIFIEVCELISAF